MGWEKGARAERGKMGGGGGRRKRKGKKLLLGGGRETHIGISIFRMLKRTEPGKHCQFFGYWV